MRNKLIIGLSAILCFIGIKDVGAASSAYPGQSLYESLKSSYNSFKDNLPNVTASSSTSKTVTLYGRSICSTSNSSCDYNYAGYSVNDDQKDVLNDIVTCANGEKYIIYQFMGSGKEDYMDDNKAGYDSGTSENAVYWSEDYSVQCSNNNTTSSGEVIENTNTSNQGNSSTGGNDYNSSTTVPPEATGVETYYIILGIVGILTYGLMTIVKKYNLFKKI